jgi:hypothetical protein
MLAMFIAWLLLAYFTCLSPIKFVEGQTYAQYLETMHKMLLFPFVIGYTWDMAISLILRTGLVIARFIGDEYTISETKDHAD